MAKSLHSNALDSSPLEPSRLDQWFSVERQTHYIQQVRQQIEITRRRAECFVRLWAYLLLKQRVTEQEQEQGAIKSIVKLIPVQGDSLCSHREAADVFYANRERGSDRAAGMMLDELAKLNLISRTFDGNVSTIRVRPLANLDHGLETLTSVPLDADAFNPRMDAVFSAQLLATHYDWLPGDPNATAYKISQALRRWSAHYSLSIRVLRQRRQPGVVGVYSLFPVAARSNIHFFNHPGRSLYLSTDKDIDPLEMAKPGDRECTVVFVRSWAIATRYLSQRSVRQSFDDMRATLRLLRQDFPNLCDIYSLSINPGSEAIAQAIGFQKTVQDPELPIAWLYIPFDQFLEIEIDAALAPLTFLPK